MNKPQYRFHIITQGDESLPAILFLHGFMGCADDWRIIFDNLSDSFYCIAIDLPGHGKTEVIGDDKAYRMEQVAEGLVHQLASLGIIQSHLVGYSMGGRLAVYLAVHYPHLWKRVIFESTSPGLKTEAERKTRQKQDNAIAERLMQVPLSHFVDEWYRQPIFSRMLQYPDRFVQLKQSRLKNDISGLVKSLQQMGTGSQPSLWEHLSRITAPTLLIVGSEDTKFRAIANEMNIGLQMGKIKEVPYAGHVVHWEQPKLFATLVYEFLNT